MHVPSTTSKHVFDGLASLQKGNHQHILKICQVGTLTLTPNPLLDSDMSFSNLPKARLGDRTLCERSAAREAVDYPILCTGKWREPPCWFGIQKIVHR